ncbi:hypothetical protein [Flavobacterium sp. LAR06]|uniref:hypothetical protein n=1 Tax=Flavobacterium sp. LAR06 TaxID=3064897 RepID=UPI0035C1CA1A
MKKATLTIGLFSLIMVATSFANPSTSNTFSNEKLSIVPPNDGSIVGGNKKRDFHAVTAKLDINGSIVRGNKKLDL